MRVAVVTGAGSGVGRAIALRFAREGWMVALVGRSASSLAGTIAEADAATVDRLATFACDVSDIGLDTLRAVQTDLRVLSGALTNPRECLEGDAPRFISQIVARIELALALAKGEQERWES